MRVETGLTEVRVSCNLRGFDVQTKVSRLLYENLDPALCVLSCVDVAYRDAQHSEQGASVKCQRFGLGRGTLGRGRRPWTRDVGNDGFAVPVGSRGLNVPAIRIFPVIQKRSHQIILLS